MLFAMLADVGRAVARREGLVHAADFLREPIGTRYRLALEVLFGRPSPALGSAAAYTYLRTSIRELAPSESAALLYRKGPDAGADFLPVVRYQRAPSERTGEFTSVPNRLIPALRDAARWCDENARAEASVLEQIASSAESNETRITQDAAREAAPFKGDREREIVIYAAIQEGAAISPLVTLPVFRDLLADRGTESWRRREAGKEAAELQHGICAVCSMKAARLCGNFTVLPCFTHDDPSMIAGGLDAKRGVRNFPVCVPCALAVALGRSKAQELKFRLGSLPYFLLPRSADPSAIDVFLELAAGQRRTSLEAGHLRRVLGDEREILESVAERFASTDAITLTMAFHRENKRQWHLLGEVTEILPSRIRGVLEVKHECERLPEVGVDGAVHLERFWKMAGQERTGAFLRYLEAVFGGVPLRRETVLRDAARHLRRQFDRPRLDAIRRDETIRTFLIVEFLRRLRVLPEPQEVAPMTGVPMDSPTMRFLADHPQAFHCPELRISFLTGALVAAVAYEQYRKLKSEPILRKVQGLRVDQRKLRALFPALLSKVTHYRARGKCLDLEQAIAREWSEAPREWRVRDDESALAFAIGMSLRPTLARRERDEEAGVGRGTTGTGTGAAVAGDEDDDEHGEE